jgi:hypothetical protein
VIYDLMQVDTDLKYKKYNRAQVQIGFRVRSFDAGMGGFYRVTFLDTDINSCLGQMPHARPDQRVYFWVNLESDSVGTSSYLTIRIALGVVSCGDF